MDLPHFIPVLIDDGRYRTALITSDSFGPFPGILVTNDPGGPDPMAVATEICRRLNEHKETP